jgi:hypothetical protein
MRPGTQEAMVSVNAAVDAVESRLRANAVLSVFELDFLFACMVLDNQEMRRRNRIQQDEIASLHDQLGLLKDT